jgi:hypothetical protein
MIYRQEADSLNERLWVVLAGRSLRLTNREWRYDYFDRRIDNTIDDLNHMTWGNNVSPIRDEQQEHRPAQAYLSG